MKPSEAPTLADLRAMTTTNIRAAGAFLGLSGAAAYRAANNGDIPTINVGTRRRVPVPLLLQLVGLPYEKPDAPDRQQFTAPDPQEFTRAMQRPVPEGLSGAGRLFRPVHLGDDDEPPSA